jgi:MoaA/NifB/PqqE/SkfB family radical SAM enzyme
MKTTKEENKEIKSYPHPTNFCGGNFQDWLEVNLIKSCNAKCPWCIEKIGWHPTNKAEWKQIAKAAVKTKKKNIILLGGEPTLYKDLQQVITYLNKRKRNVWITTNGSKLTPEFIKKNLKGIHGVNISIHHYDLNKNKEITGMKLNKDSINSSIQYLVSNGVKVRINCNCINKYIDSEQKLLKFVSFFSKLGVQYVRFAELKVDEENFIDLAKILRYKYGLNDDPFALGCNKDAIIYGVHVNFRQMCGLQTTKRKKPIGPVQAEKEVLYYDGVVYDGWQLKKTRKEKDMKQAAIEKMIKEFSADLDAMGLDEKKKVMLIIKLEKRLKSMPEEVVDCGGGGCRY